ncbi:hypothetical protein [Octadecabacter arcticus]|jgi:hypothetical protein|nr:hypothetical protein [Octadecabacter arcticus]
MLALNASMSALFEPIANQMFRSTNGGFWSGLEAGAPRHLVLLLKLSDGK